MIALEEIRATLHPELEARFNLVSSRTGHTRIIFSFETEEAGICGAAAVTEFLSVHEIPGHVTQHEKYVFLKLEEGIRDE